MNMFLEVLPDTHKTDLAKMHANEQFTKRITDDLAAAFDCRITYTREAELKSRFDVTKFRHNGWNSVASFEVDQYHIHFVIHASGTCALWREALGMRFGQAKTPFESVDLAMSALERMGNEANKKSLLQTVFREMHQACTKEDIAIDDYENFLQGYGNCMRLSLRILPHESCKKALSKALKMVVKFLHATKVTTRLDVVTVPA